VFRPQSIWYSYNMFVLYLGWLVSSFRYAPDQNVTFLYVIDVLNTFSYVPRV